MALPSFRVVVPMYNEANGAEKCIHEISAALHRFGHRGGLIVVNDGSQDGTRPILDRLASEFPNLKFIHRDSNGGYGAALRSGVQAAAEGGSEYVIFMDSDLTNDPADIPKFISEIDKGADAVKATRFRRGGGMVGVPFRRAFVSRAGNAVASILFRNGLSDCTNGFRAVRVDLLLQVPLRERGFAVIVEELLWLTLKKANIVEVPTILTSRSESLRPTSFVYSADTIRNYLRYALLGFLRKTPS